MNPQPKNKPFRCKKAITYFRNKQCAVCENNRTTGHHEPLKSHGMGSKGPDDQQVPLCLMCHRARHDMGRTTFWTIHEQNWKELVKYWKEKFHTENPGWDDK